MNKKITFLILALLALMTSPGWGQAPVNTVLWGENFAHFGTKTPSAAGTGTGTTIYGNATITYAQSSNNTKGYNEYLAGGTAPELLLSQSNQTWTISGIKSGAAKRISLTFLSNKTTFNLTCSSDAYTVTGSGISWTLTLGNGKTAPETFNLTLINTGSKNARIDNVVLTVTEAGTPSTDPSITCANITDVPYEGVTDAEANVTISNADGWTPNVTCDGSIVTAASLNNDNTKVIYSVSENEGNTDREGSFTITLSKDDEENITKVVSVTQEAAPQTYNVTLSSNGVVGTPQSVQGSCEPANPANIPTGFSFAGWTESESNIQIVDNPYTPTSDVTLFAVFSREEQGYEENVVIVDGSTLTSTATEEETIHTFDGVSYKFSAGAKQQAVQNNAVNNFMDGYAVLIGKSGAYIHNDNPFGNGITKFEIYANKGASTRVSVGVYFSTNAITQYTTGESTWTETLSSDDNVYDASGKLPDGAKYFWYQVTNSNNSQIQFRITYKKQTTTTKYYTRVFLNETATANITIGGPSIIPASSTLNMGAYTLANATAANLIIEDGGQLICNNEVAATVKKNIIAHDETSGWYTIASPLTSTTIANTGALNENYDLYTYDEEYYTWRNYEVVENRTTYDWFKNGNGYLYANGTATDIEFAGTLRAGNEANVVVNLSYASTYQKLKGFNLVGNPFAHNIIMGTNAIMTNENTGYYVVENGANLVAKKSDTPIKPCQGFMVQATGEGQKITFNPSAKETQTEHEYITIAAGNGDFMDMAYICTNADEKLGKITLDNPTAKVYLQQSGNDYAIAPLGEATSMVVCFKAPASGTYTINVSSDHEGVSLKDMKTGYVTAINHSASYTFEASENDAESRFKIMFGTTGVEENGAQMFVFQSGSNLIISGEGCVQIIDMMGRVLRTAQVESNATVSTEGLTAGAYVVRMLTAGGVQTQKVIVK